MASIRHRLKEATYQLDKARRAASIHPERFSSALVEVMCDSAELHRENQSERRAAQLLREATLYAKDHRLSLSASTLDRLNTLQHPTPRETHAEALSETTAPPVDPDSKPPVPEEASGSDAPEPEPGPISEVPPEPDEPELEPQPATATPDPDRELRSRFEAWLERPQTGDSGGVILRYQDALEQIRQAPDDYSQSLTAEIREAAGKIYLAAGKLWDAERMFLLAFRNRLKMGDPSESADRSRKTLRMLSEVYDEAGERRVARDYRDSARLRDDDAVLEAVEKLLAEPSAAEHDAA